MILLEEKSNEKKEFINLLRRKLKRFSCKDIDEAICYYDELIYEKMQEGLSQIMQWLLINNYEGDKALYKNYDVEQLSYLCLTKHFISL